MATALLVDPLAFAELSAQVVALQESLAMTQSLLATTAEATQAAMMNMSAHQMNATMSLASFMEELNTTVYAHESGNNAAMDHAWLIICGALVMFMHAGFSMLEAGCCRAGFAQSVLSKNLLNCCVSTLGWLVIGFPIAYGGMVDEECAFDGCAFFARGLTPQEGLDPDAPSHISYSTGPLAWFFQWAFCMTSATIVSGAVAERLQIGGYCIFCLLMTSIIYPVVVSWTWNSNGFLYNWETGGYMDFAGSGIVHLTGGIGALVGTILVKPRTGRFDENTTDEFDPHDVPMIVLGTIILWFGWYGFNCGSTLGMNESAGYWAGVVAVNTTIAPAFGGMVVTFVRRAQMGRWMTAETCGGILAGLVSITAGCGNVHPWASVIIGSVGGLFYMAAADMLAKMKIDDPVQAFPVHGACGIWGVLAACFFDWGVPYGYFHGWGWTDASMKEDGSVFGMSDALTAAGIFLGLNLVWTGATLGITFAALGAMGMLRVPVEAEREGLDAHEFSPKAARSDNSPKPTAKSVNVVPNGNN